ncbi:hypothetical protein BGX27_001632 [Mortierella sp. AM989]|nr:hypothetical protein BGX27_001632 [Mortierella sp. AM989]
MSNTSKTHTDAINASQLMDAIVTAPTWNQSIFTDSIQLFPNSVLSETLLHGGPQKPEACQDKRPLSEVSAELQKILKMTRQELMDASTRTPSNASKSLSLASSSLRLDPTKIEFFDRISIQLVQSMKTFEEAYDQQISSQVAGYYDHRFAGDTAIVNRQETIPGLGQAARDLNIAQESMLRTIEEVCGLQESISYLINPSSDIQKWIGQAKEDLLRSCSEDSGVQVTLDRLSTMSATLERAQQRIASGNGVDTRFYGK